MLAARGAVFFVLLSVTGKATGSVQRYPFFHYWEMRGNKKPLPITEYFCYN